MAVLKPFFGLRYNEAVAGPIDDLVAPPYDVINVDDVLALQSRSNYNITHLTRPLDGNPYDTASSQFREWIKDGGLTFESERSFYVYRQRFQDPENESDFEERVGLVGLLELEEYSSGGVLPHENTLRAARADRLDLLRKSLANFESIYGLFSDPNARIASLLEATVPIADEVIEVADAIGSSHTLSRITDAETIAAISQFLETVPIFIADGHHRYETSLGFSKERPDVVGSRYILMTLTALEDPGLLVLPTHRLLKNFGPGEVEILPARLIERGFEVVEKNGGPDNLQPHQFILVTSDREYRVSLPDGADLSKLVTGEQSDAWKSLDVSLLHTSIIGDILGVTLENLSTTDRVAYTRDSAEARQAVKSGGAQAAFLMARPTVDQMKKVSEAGDKMPQKSTFFYPKLLSGLVLYDLLHD